MTWTRRGFLAASAAVCAGTVIVGRTVAPLLGGAAEARLRLLTAKASIPSAAFERGVRARGEGAGLAIDALALPRRHDLTRWRGLVAEIRGIAVLGVVSAAEFVLVNELIREAGAVLMFQGEHTIGVLGAARHTLLASTGSEVLGATLSRSRDAWPETLGSALVRIAAHGWESTGVMTESVAGHDGARRTSNCVSFVFVA